MIKHLLTEAELDILMPTINTPDARMWRERYLESYAGWRYRFPELFEAIAADTDPQSRYAYAELFVHWQMSNNMGFPMVVGLMTEHYSGIFPCTKDTDYFYTLFQLEGAWILMLFDNTAFEITEALTVYQVNHGEDAIMFLSPEAEEC